ncbi:MAG: pirin family protein [Polyangiaceae bacterium]|nr:pirin family protein [Polyangiaceae bacterium]
MPLLSRRGLLCALPPAAAALACGRGSAPVVSAPSTVREIRQIVPALATRDGAGVSLSRSLGSQALPLLDPFLLLDEIRSERPEDYVRGFPDHPHRGFETVTYMLDGFMEHRDSVGNRGRLSAGSAQWMTAGRGIVHSEMPEQDRGLLWGLQLWVNLPARLKMTKPRYQDILPGRIPELSVAGAAVRVVAGQIGGERGPVEGIYTAPTMLDVTLAAGDTFEHELPARHNAFAYVLEGAVGLGAAASPVRQRELAVLGPGASVRAASAGGARLLLLAAEPIGEPVARRGPFVMNTEAELDQAVADYRAGRLVAGG